MLYRKRGRTESSSLIICPFDGQRDPNLQSRMELGSVESIEFRDERTDCNIEDLWSSFICCCYYYFFPGRKAENSAFANWTTIIIVRFLHRRVNVGDQSPAKSTLAIILIPWCWDRMGMLRSSEARVKPNQQIFFFYLWRNKARDRVANILIDLSNQSPIIPRVNTNY